MVSIISAGAVREGKLLINRVIEGLNIGSITELNEIDDSFLQIVG